VHIADVSYFVRPGSALDEEAFKRGASVYYGDTVLPMLPKELSSNLCSLNEGEDRLAFSCIMQLDERAAVVSFQFEKSIIRSRVKGVYGEINALLTGEEKAELDEKYQSVRQQLSMMEEVYRKLLILREERGYIDIESGEAKIILDQHGHCVEIQKRERGVSECIIEEFMLLANECAAKLARTQELPLVYRVHEAPELERARRLLQLLNACGVPATFAKPV
ncbi:ribonuclease R, partial [gut metagenome]